VIAGGFALFGQEVWVIRLVQGLLYLLTLATTAWIGKTALGSWRVGVIAVWLGDPNREHSLPRSVWAAMAMLLIGNLFCWLAADRQRNQDAFIERV
jgi:hypothetical protein